MPQALQQSEPGKGTYKKNFCFTKIVKQISSNRQYVSFSNKTMHYIVPQSTEPSIINNTNYFSHSYLLIIL